MKLKCIKDMTDPSSGCFGIGKSPAKKIKGLTLDKEYEALVVSKISYKANDCTFRFFLYNDDGMWKDYSRKLFKPA